MPELSHRSEEPAHSALTRGAAFRSRGFAQVCGHLGIKLSFTRPYRPQTNGRAERFIQSALCEWANGIPYNHSAERTAMLACWTHHYNWHRPTRVSSVSRQSAAWRSPVTTS